jgi:hypothetical protein
MENNRLIAEFMGYNEEIVNDEVYFTLPDMLESLSDEELHYHSDWNWLMEVVEKILNISLELDSMEMYYNITDSIPRIDQTYNDCLNFIEWYNKQK